MAVVAQSCVRAVNDVLRLTSQGGAAAPGDTRVIRLSEMSGRIGPARIGGTVSSTAGPSMPGEDYTGLPVNAFVN